MKRLQKIKSGINFVAVPLACFAAKVSLDYLGRLQIHFLVKGLLVLLAIFLVYIVIRQAGTWILFSSTVRQILIGKEWIEGTWMDIVRVKDQIQKVGVLYFEVREDSIFVTGSNYKTNGEVDNSFTSEITKFDWPKLRLWYQSDKRTIGSPTSGGFSELRFVPREGPPQKYSGFCQDYNGKRGNCSGWRIIDKSILKKLDNPSTTKEVILQQVEGESIKHVAQQGS